MEGAAKFAMALWIGGLVGLVAYVVYIQNCGTMIAENILLHQQMDRLVDYADTLRRKAFLQSGDQQYQWVESTPLKLVPEVGELEFRVVVKQGGLIRDNQGEMAAWDLIVNPSYTLANADKQEVISKSDSKEMVMPSTSSTPLHKTACYRMCRLKMPAAASYVFYFGFNTILTVSSNIDITLRVYKDTKKIDKRVLFFFLFCMFSGFAIGCLFVTHGVKAGAK